MTRLGYQIPNFDYPGLERSDVFRATVESAKAAEASGFDTVLVMDHFYQLPGLGAPDNSMLECYTLLGALAQHTSKVRLGALVTGNTYRNPAILAKCLTTLDHVSGGRAQLGIGAGWFELEHNSFGIEFGTFTHRFEKLEESLQIILPMLRGERPTFSGEYYNVVEAINEPAPLSRIPVMIGGGGEKKTLRMVAQYADLGNLNCEPGEVGRKLDALDGHCERLGRDRGEIVMSWNRAVCIAETTAEAEKDRDAFLLDRGMDYQSLTQDFQTMVDRYLAVGDISTIGAQFAEWKALGADGFTVSMPAQGHKPEHVEMLGKVLTSL
ncbi:putative F420-dependent oxidoreductase, Rv1855c family [Actinobacteria bacterium IMCC26256]|nr:putative F420-dependent oxidoreductase, Rv1855c family [Actinobacteria bacterium IMCC26256]